MAQKNEHAGRLLKCPKCSRELRITQHGRYPWHRQGSKNARTRCPMGGQFVTTIRRAVHGDIFPYEPWPNWRPKKDR